MKNQFSTPVEDATLPAQPPSEPHAAGHADLEEIKKQFYREGKLLLMNEPGHDPDRKYTVYEHNKHAIISVCRWIAKDATGPLHPQKGIGLEGNVGAGKGVIFKITNQLLKKYNQPTFKTINCAELKDIYADKDRRYILKDLKKAYIFKGSQQVPNDIFFADLGLDQVFKDYGNRTDLMAELIDARYRLWIDYGIKTHFDTNLLEDEIKEKYGDRVESRIQQMSSWVGVGAHKDSIDFRKKNHAFQHKIEV